ncbi:MAG: EamA family transporter [Dyadobacter sp.]|uniref:EamA family transporter n=1 Tax=Dyadobacter sp. TaxID=1914288 RepID=UPI003263019C
MWKYYALHSAMFAIATSILAKVGVKGIGGNLAMAVRTVVILVIAWGIVLFSGQTKEVKDISRTNLIFLVLSGIATGLSWIFYFKALETGDVPVCGHRRVLLPVLKVQPYKCPAAASGFQMVIRMA